MNTLHKSLAKNFMWRIVLMDIHVTLNFRQMGIKDLVVFKRKIWTIKQIQNK